MDLTQLVSFVTLLVILWYTYETRIIRMDAGRQAAVNPSAKLWDRQNDLDRLTILNPTVTLAFQSKANRSEPYFYAPADVVPRDELYCQLKALVYLHLNFFEEIYTTTSNSASVAKHFERESWDKFIFEYMHHALLREVFIAERNRAYTGAFVNFLEEHTKEWAEGPADEDLF